MRFVTILRVHKTPGGCAECGKPSRPLIPAYNRFTTREVLLCPSCLTWHQQMDEQVKRDLGGCAA